MTSHSDTPSALRVVAGRVSIREPRAGAGRLAADPDELAEGVLAGDRMRLARAITLVESNAPQHASAAARLMHRILPHAGQALRVGITGVPGVGKSTFIEHFGLYLCNADHKVAVLAVDPSSSVTRGSILGDKTRMEKLSAHPGAFIRPSPAAGTLGGVGRKTRESLLLCEAAGFNVILVETVGVGQSEITVRGMVDFFLLLLLSGAGDDLQGIKKGIIEMADAMVLTKADGDNRLRAQTAASELRRVVHHLQPSTPGWQTPVRMCSALENAGIPELWAMLEEFRTNTDASGVFNKRRNEQSCAWFHTLLQEGLLRWFDNRQGMHALVRNAEKRVLSGQAPAAAVVEEILSTLESGAPTP